jgi:hypothetical protein
MNQFASNVAPATSEFNLEEWKNSPGSIYVKYVPSNMDKEELTYIFCKIGKVSRVDIVNSAPNKKTGACYRMAFIHFEFWHHTQFSNQLCNTLVMNFPEPVTYVAVGERHTFCTDSSLNHFRDSLSLMINTRPVPKTIYNVDQLSDMYHRLREEYNTTVTQLRGEVDELRALIANMLPTKSEKESHTIEIAEEQMTFENSRADSERDPVIFKCLP